MFDQISGYHGLAELTDKANHHVSSKHYENNHHLRTCRLVALRSLRHVATDFSKKYLKLNQLVAFLLLSNNEEEEEEEKEE